jgi:hypothetical protein
MTTVKSSRARLSLRTSCRRFALAALAASGLALLGGAAADAAERATVQPVISALAVDSAPSTAGAAAAHIALEDWPWAIPPRVIKPGAPQVVPLSGDDDWPWNVAPKNVDWPWNPGHK